MRFATLIIALLAFASVTYVSVAQPSKAEIFSNDGPSASIASPAAASGG